MARIEYHKQKSMPKKWLFVGMLFSFLLISSSIIFLLYPFASKEKDIYFQGENPILYKGVQAGNALIEGDSVYMPISFLKEHFDDGITFDEKSNSIIITTKNKVVQMPSESLTYFVNEKPVQLHFSVFKAVGKEMYLAIDPLLAYYPIEYSILPETNAIWVKENGQRIHHAKATEKEVHEEKLRLRKDASLQSPYTDQVHSKESLYIEGELEDYYFVRKENGVAGYIQRDYIHKEKEEKVIIQQHQEEQTVSKIDGPIHLTWEAIYSSNPDTAKIPAMPGVNVLSPTWFELGDVDGSIKNLGSIEFVEWSKSNGYQLWGLFSNAFDPTLTHEAFKDFETRQKMIRQLLHFSQMYQLDGINLDIENVNPEDGPLITQFVREAVPYFHDAGLVVSMDITFISSSGNWSVFYEREKLAGLVDYLIVMAYDEHWGTSPKAGSVASFPWVEKNLIKLLELVPNEKLILGVPLYTRIWEVKDTGEVSSKAISMAKVKQWLQDNGVKPVYDEVSGQNYAELYSEKEQITYKIWIEDELSLKKRADLAREYQLAGVASWSRYFADESAWAALSFSNDHLTQK